DVPRWSVAPDEVALGEAERAAAFVRTQWSMGTGPAGHLIRLLENKGVLVVVDRRQAAALLMMWIHQEELSDDERAELLHRFPAPSYGNGIRDPGNSGPGF